MKLTKPQKLIFNTEKTIGGPVAVMCGIMTVDRVRPEADVVAAIQKIYETNDALNYRLDDSGEEPQMYFESPDSREVKVIRVNALSELEEIGKKEASTPFDMKGWLSELTAVFYPEGYGMIIKVHHLLGDAWSMSLACTQLNSILEGTPWVRYSYEEYINAETEYLSSKRYERDRRFFLNAFQQCKEPVLLSEKYSTDYRVEKLNCSLTPQIYNALRNYAEKSELSEFVCLFGVFSVLYGKLKNCADAFFIGMPVLNRTSEKDLNTVGMYVNTVPVPIFLDFEKSFPENLQQLQDSVFSVFKHQKFNYNDIIEAVGDEFGYRGKLYDSVVNYLTDEIISEENMRSTDYSRVLQAENLQMFFQNRNREEQLTLEYNYRSDVFSAEDIEHFHSAFMRVLSYILTDDKQPLKDIILIGEKEKKLFESFNSIGVPYDKTESVYDLFAEQTKKIPDKTALVASDCTLTYAHLKDSAVRLAKGLAEQGVKKGDIVAFCLPRDSRLICSMLGIMHSGAVYLPLDPQQPGERIEYILDDSGAKLCITEENYESLLDNEALNVKESVSADDICYCIYTSGSTGMPKGTLISHQNVMNYIGSSKEHICGIMGDEWKTILSVTSVGFDIFVTESLLPLANGKSIILANEKQSRSGNQLQEILKAHPVDVLQTTPSKMQMFLQNMEDKTCLRTLKCIFLGGEILNKSLVVQLQKLSEAKIFNVYGPTEATVWATCAGVEDADNITIGKPLANTQIYIVDRYIKPVPIGVTGELCIAGDGVCAGYLNRPELTAEKFIDNPFGDGKLYKTGDLAHWREDGNIIFVGRNDFQVKINGQRIELGEIEAALTAIKGIESAAVTVRNEDDRQLLCAFYTGNEISAKELRSMLGKTLPRYMVPQVFTHLEKMPLNASGKTDRKALEQHSVHFVAGDYKAPQSAEEKVLLSTAKEILKAEQIGMLDNFFDLGGDSLKSIAWIALLEKQGYTLMPSDIFSCADMEELKEKLRKTEKESITEPDYPPQLPLTMAQKEIYIAQSVAPDKPLYNIPYIIKVKALDVDKLQYAVDCMLKRHEILRTRFESKGGEIYQIIDENARCIVESIEGEISEFIRPFELSKAPLIRVGYQGNTVIFDLHHIIADGSSMPVFFRELNEYYMGREPKESFIPYKYFAVTEKEAAEDITYWNEMFSDEVPSLNLRYDLPRSAVKTYNGKTLYKQMPEAIDEKVAAFCKEQNITPFVYYCGAFQILLHKFSTQEDIVIGTPMSSRTAKNLGTIGMFVHTLPLRCKPEGNKTVGEFLGEVRQLSIEAARHSGIAVSEIAASKDKSLFDVMFTYQAEEMTSLIFGDMPAEITATPLTASKYGFDFTLYPRKEGNILSATFNTSLFNEKTIQQMMNAYDRILSEAQNADKNLCDISLIDEEEDNLLNSFNNTAVTYDKSKSVYALFERQVQNSPNSKAIIFKEQQISYASLLEKVDKMAACLSASGVGKSDVVAIYLERSPLLLILQLAVMKIGAVFLPADKRYPIERLHFLCRDCNVSLLITKDENAVFSDINCITPDELLKKEIKASDFSAFYNNNCYIIYTSGSTGTPKGCYLKQSGIVNFCINNNTLSALKNNQNNVFACVNSVAFDYFIAESLLPLLNGFTVVLCDEDESMLQKAFLKLVVEHKINVLMTTPTRLSLFYDNGVDCSVLNKLDCICTSGEPLTGKLLKRLYEVSENAAVFNPLGPSECTVWDLGGELDRNAGIDIHLGKPIANTHIYIVDKYLKPVPIGVTGELCIAGDGVGVGYVNRPELTAEKFIDNPFGEGKLYKTGDLAYWREDGNIVFAGRNDFQVKINGQRIELGEIEAALTAIKGIESAAVIVRNEDDRQLLCAFYTGSEINAKELRSMLGKTLPGYMVPQAFEHLEKMPLNTSGKIDRRALETVYVTVEVQAYESPQTPTEEKICSIFCKILNTEQIGRNDSFYDLGGTSLQIIQILSYSPLDKLSPSDFLVDPTPAALAKKLDGSTETDYNYIVELYMPNNVKKAVVLFPFAGGNAAAYTALVAKAREEKSEIALYFVDWFGENEIDEIADEIRLLTDNMPICFYSHCAGSALAMALLDRLNANEAVVENYIAGASIPPRKLSLAINTWDFVSDKVILKVLRRCGLPFEADNNGKPAVSFKRFRRDTGFWNNYFRNKNTKTNVKATVVVSKNDLFTRNYANAKELWQRYVAEVNDVVLIDTPSHYFQNSDPELLLNLFSELFN